MSAATGCGRLDHVRGYVIEWTMLWTDSKRGERRLDRGTEWLAFRAGRIAEVRACHHGGPKHPGGGLLGFDRAARGGCDAVTRRSAHRTARNDPLHRLASDRCDVIEEREGR